MGDLMRRVDGGFAEEISRRPGFCSYEALDCGDGEVVTISVFGEAGQAEASRELAQRWSDENLGDFGFTRLEALHGEILVSRAVEDVLEPAHAGASREFASIRRYMLRSGSTDELMHIVDETFAEQITGVLRLPRARRGRGRDPLDQPVRRPDAGGGVGRARARLREGEARRLRHRAHRGARRQGDGEPGAGGGARAGTCVEASPAGAAGGCARRPSGGAHSDQSSRTRSRCSAPPSQLPGADPLSGEE